MQSGTRELPQAPHLTIIGTPAASTLGWVSWSLFEWARNPYVILVTIYIFAPYFSKHVVGDPVHGQALLGFASSLSGGVIAVLAPFLGAISDKSGRRKPWIVAFVLLMTPAIFALWFATPNAGGIGIWGALGLMMIVSVCFELGAVFHNAMLPSVAPVKLIGYASRPAHGPHDMGPQTAACVPHRHHHLPRVRQSPLTPAAFSAAAAADRKFVNRSCRALLAAGSGCAV